MKTAPFVLVSVAAALAPSLGAQAATRPSAVSAQKVSIVHLEKAGRFRVTIDGELFTEYRYADQRVPICYPVHGVKGLPMTRNYPMKAAANEAKDHPHHRSLWFAHGGVNGHDFWHGKNCRVVQDGQAVSHGKGVATLTTKNTWFAGVEKVCRDERTLVFRAGPSGRYIDYSIRIVASFGDVVFGDTKEGTMALRLTPTLRLKGRVAKGKAQNAQGVQGRKIWGKRADWVDYHGPVKGETVGVAIFDHPTNFGYPCRWHARDYGLVAANPFGIGHFERKKLGPGHRLAKGGAVGLTYRFFFHAGDAKAADVAGEYAKFRKLSTKRVAPTSRKTSGRERR